MVAGRAQSESIQLTHDGEVPVVFTPADYDRFVLTQHDAIEAAKRHTQAQEASTRLGEKLAASIYRIHEWCKANTVARCVVAPRMDDIMVVVIASDNDPEGKLHDLMSALDLSEFQNNQLRLSWLLLRASEADGLSAFVDLDIARTIFRAHLQAAP